MQKNPRLRVVVDVQKRVTPFEARPSIINLRHYPRRKQIPIATIGKGIVAIMGGAMFLLGTVSAPVQPAAGMTAADQQQQAQLQQQLTDLESQITQYEGKIADYQKQGNSLSSEIKKLEASIAAANLKVKALELTIQQLGAQITQTQTDITTTETDIGTTKTSLVGLLQTLYEQGSDSAVEIFIKNPRLSDFTDNMNNLVMLQSNVRSSLEQSIQLDQQLVNQQETLATERLDTISLRDYQNAQKQQVLDIQGQKKTLLAETQGNESKYQVLLDQTKKTAAEVRNQIFKLLGGGELSFGDAYKIAKYAEDATGIRAALILAVLSQESAVNGVIGRDLGKCYYNTPANNVSGSVMKDSQKPDFFAILTTLNMDPAKTPVSCPIPHDGAYGGAIGPAQFLPSTWQVFADGIASITGDRPPSPFNNSDAFVGTALYLKDSYNASACINYAAAYSNRAPEQTLRERCTAARYYAGSNWWNYRLTYGDAVAQRAIQFQQDIDILNGA